MAEEYKPVMVTEGVYALQVPIPNNPLGYLLAYLIKSDNSRKWTLIDTGWDVPVAMAALERQLGLIGIAMRDISDILITHSHPDHYGLAGKVKRLSGARLAMGRIEAAFSEQRFTAWDNYAQAICHTLVENGITAEDCAAMWPVVPLTYTRDHRVDILLDDGEEISRSGMALRVIVTPGHSPGQTCYYNAHRRLLFSGDHVLPTITPNVSYNPGSGDNPLADYLASLQKLRELQVDLVLPAHEHCFTDLLRRIEEITDHHQERLQKLERLLGNVPKTVCDLAHEMSWSIGGWDDLDMRDRRLAALEVLAHLGYLIDQKRIEKTLHDGVWFYLGHSKE